jgi:hypothetical protein
MPSVFRTFWTVFYAAHAAGLAALPVLLLARCGSGRAALVGAAMTGIAAVHLYTAHGVLWPYLGNTVTPWGTFFPDEVVMGARPLVFPPAARIAISVAGCAAGGALVARLFARTPPAPGREGAVRRLIVCFALVHLGLLLAAAVPFDRYFLPLFPAALALASSGAPVPRIRSAAGRATLVLFAAISVALMHDWLAWNAARWAVGRRALEAGVLSGEIEGGYEWNGHHHPRRAAGIAPPRASDEVEGPGRFRELFPHVRARHALSFSVPRGTVALDSEPYRLWLAPGAGAFHRIAPSGGAFEEGRR